MDTTHTLPTTPQQLEKDAVSALLWARWHMGRAWSTLSKHQRPRAALACAASARTKIRALSRALDAYVLRCSSESDAWVRAHRLHAVQLGLEISEFHAHYDLTSRP